jgi:ribosomal protein L4
MADGTKGDTADVSSSESLFDEIPKSIRDPAKAKTAAIRQGMDHAPRRDSRSRTEGKTIGRSI